MIFRIISNIRNVEMFFFLKKKNIILYYETNKFQVDPSNKRVTQVNMKITRTHLSKTQIRQYHKGFELCYRVVSQIANLSLAKGLFVSKSQITFSPQRYEGILQKKKKAQEFKFICIKKQYIS